uniref:Variant surface glycoprotein 1125.4781 n=2 Tax=Trypanosoma brucei TaxID=5691 RepID=A0A1J0RAU1_9TRYP|nr:variant surface glycoprotein 1125.4781 [Trypanosoma brucei]
MNRSNVQYGRDDSATTKTQTPQTAFLIFALTATQVATALHPKRPAVTTACHAAYYLEDIATNAQNLVTAAITNAQKANIEAAKLLAVANSKAGAEALAARILGLTMLGSATQVLDTIKRKLDIINAGTTAAAELAGQMLAVQELETTAIESSKYVAAASAYTNGNNIQAKPKVTPHQHGSCMKTAKERQAHEGKTVDQTPNNHNLVLFALKPVNLPTKAANNDLTLCGSSGGTPGTDTVDSHPCTNAQNTNIALKGGKIFTNQKITITRQHGAAHENYGQSTASGAVPTPQTIAKSTAAIAKLEEAAADIGTLSATLDIKTLITAADLRERLAKAIDGENAKYSDQETKTKVDNLLKEVIGENGDEIKNAVGKSLDDMTPPKAAVGGNGDRQLKTITNPKELADAATCYTVRRFINEQEVKKKKQESPSCPTNTDKLTEPAKSADECKKHKTSETLQR